MYIGKFLIYSLRQSVSTKFNIYKNGNCCGWWSWYDADYRSPNNHDEQKIMEQTEALPLEYHTVLLSPA